MQINFQTSDSIPPPYANKIIIEVRNSDQNQEGIEIRFTQTYLDREGLDEEEILEEGFSLEDDVFWEGRLNNTWQEAILASAEKLKPYREVTSSVHDTLFIKEENEKFTPFNVDQTKRLIEQMQQAIFELIGRESPLRIEIRQISKHEERSTTLKASFADRNYEQLINKQTVPQHWNQLDEHLKLLFAGDYYYEKATNKPPNRHGLFVNLGNEWWFEVGKSLLVSPDKIAGFLV